MAATSNLPIHVNLALSNLHAAIDKYGEVERWEKWRNELFQALADLNSHAARRAIGLPWPPPVTPQGPETPQEAALA